MERPVSRPGWALAPPGALCPQVGQDPLGTARGRVWTRRVCRGGPDGGSPLRRAAADRPSLRLQVDQRVLQDLLSEKLPKLMAHLGQHRVDLSFVTFNWLLVVFADSLISNILLQVWDAFLYEGTKVGRCGGGGGGGRG